MRVTTLLWMHCFSVELISHLASPLHPHLLQNGSNQKRLTNSNVMMAGRRVWKVSEVGRSGDDTYR